MAFLEIRMPTDYTYGASGGPGWSTRMADTEGGWRLLQPMWTEERGMWTVSYDTLDIARWAALIALHRIARGKLHGFRFQDWSDYTVTVDDLGSGIDFGTYWPFNGIGGQLYKAYKLTDSITGRADYARRVIVKPQPSTVQVYYDGVLMVVQPTVDYTTGIVAGSPPTDGHAYTWTGNFDVPVRFNSDIPSLSYDFYGSAGGGVSWQGIELVELLRTDLF